MKRLILIASILLAFSITAFGQSVSIKEVISSASDPSSCIVGKLYINTTSPGKVWARVGGGCVRVDGLAGGITNSAGANVIPKSNGTNLVASSITDDGTNVIISPSSFVLVGGTLIAPATAAGAVAGAPGLPFSSVYIGNAANNSSRITGTFTGNRVATLPDATFTFAGLQIAQTFSAANTFSVNGAANTPAITVSGTWHGQGIPSDSEPLFLIQVAGATSNNWSPSGTGFGVNAEAGDNGNLIDLQTGGFRRFSVATSTGEVLLSDGNTSATVKMLPNGTGSLRLSDNAGTAFGRLQFGGTTSSYPSLKRNGTAINVRLADDSADAPITAGAATFSGTILPDASNTRDIGSSSLRFKDVHVGTSVIIGTSNDLYIGRSGTSSLGIYQGVNDYARLRSESYIASRNDDSGIISIGYNGADLAVMNSGGVIGFSATTNAAGAAADSGFSRESAGVVRVGDGGLNANGTINAAKYKTGTNCADSAGAAACGSASAGAVVIDAGATTVVVSTTAVTANSRITITEDSSLGTELGITCNTSLTRTYAISARTEGTSFTINTSAAPVTNAACLTYRIVN